MKNKKLYLIIVLFWIFPKIGNSQNIILELDKYKLNEFQNFENKNGSNLYKTKVDYVSFTGNAQPIIYQRKENKLPDLLVYYFFKEKDSIITKINYEWDIKNFDEKSNNPQKKKIQKLFIKKFNELKKLVEEKYGIGKSIGNTENFEDVNTEKGIKEQILWKINDSIEIELYIKLRNFFKKNKYVTIPTVHHLNLKIEKIASKNRISNIQEVDKKEKINTEKLDSIVRKFNNSLKNKNYPEAKKLLSKMLTVSNDDLERIYKQIDFSKKLKENYSGIQMGLDKKKYFWLEYVYENEKPIMTKIRYIFDVDNKIIGIRPMKRIMKK